MLRLMTRRSRSGQSIVIIALGFVALIGFVGIATDTALLFVRYSTLRRAVDAAAVAAAGEVRRNTSYATMAAAAQEYITVHGLIASSVKVETCETDIFTYMQTHAGTPVKAALAAMVALDPAICTPTPTKLVRVSAQITSPTTFLSLLGFKSVLLSASTISQTAVMDVALLLDGSQSEANDTYYAELNAVATGGLPALDPFSPLLSVYPQLHPYDTLNTSGQATGAHPQGSIRSDCRVDVYNTNKSGNYAWGGCCDEPVTMKDPSGANQTTYWIDLQGNITPGLVLSGESPESNTVGVPTNRNFSGLTCLPFKQVRDAARTFLTNVDFTRGDRAMLIQFDATPHALINSPTNKGVYFGSGSSYPVFTDANSAIEALNKYAGVEISPQRSEIGCIALHHPPYPYISEVYENIAPCPDTNTGGAIQTMQALMTNPLWIRRDAVWIGVLLSDGFPNRTMGLGTINGPTAENIHMIGDPAYMPSPSLLNIDAGNKTAYATSFFTQTVPFVAGTTSVFPQPLSNTLNPVDSSALTDPGFCPWNTFCDVTGNQVGDPNTRYPDGSLPDQSVLHNPGAPDYPYPTSPITPDTVYAPDLKDYNLKYCKITDQQSAPIWWGLVSNGGPFTMPRGPEIVPPCTSSNPDARHWCMDASTGTINPQAANECSKHYDATDYARDQVDFASLIDFTTNVKGNFIAMFSVFFRHTRANSPTPLQAYILGAKFMRYVADAGDNGVIDNHVQHWYRDQLPLSPVATDLTPPDLNGNNMLYSGAPFNYGQEDPCAQYDFRETGDAPSTNPVLEAQYEALITHNCGNYYFASSSNAINLAFADIASRLFTRLTR